MSSISNLRGSVDTQTSTYDRVSGALTAGSLVLGTLSLIMFLTWLTMISPHKKGLPPLSEIPPPGDPGEEKPLGVADDILEPGVEDFPEVEVPQLADAVEAVTDAPSRYRGMLAAVDGNAAEMGRGRGLGSLNGGGNGGGGKGYERWVIEYEADSPVVYIDQLKAFGVQIGAVHKVLNDIALIYDLDSAPQQRSVKRSDEKRVYFVPSQGRLKQWDQRFAKRAGVNTTGRIMVQFYPTETAQNLARLEAEEAQRRGIEVKNIRRTTFKVRQSGNSYEYYVADMQPK